MILQNMTVVIILNLQTNLGRHLRASVEPFLSLISNVQSYWLVPKLSAYLALPLAWQKLLQFPIFLVRYQILEHLFFPKFFAFLKLLSVIEFSLMIYGGPPSPVRPQSGEKALPYC